MIVPFSITLVMTITMVWQAVAVQAATPLNDGNIRAAVAAWRSNPTSAAITYGNIWDWDTSAVTDMSYLFSWASGFNDDISKWNTSKVTTMRAMFQQAMSFNQNISRWDTGQVTTMYLMFFGAAAFNQSISKWNTAKVVDMSGTFNSAVRFNGDISGWNTSQVKSMQSMFGGASAFNRDLSNWNTAKVTSTFGMFELTSSFNQKLCWTLESLESAGHMFDNSNGCIVGSCLKNAAMASMLVVCRTPLINDGNIRSAVAAWIANRTNAALTYGNIWDWDTSAVTDMSFLFSSASGFNDDISKWNTSKVTTMLAMFQQAESFNQNISRWDTGQVTTMNHMFYGAAAFNQSISKWNTANVVDMAAMFNAAVRFNGDISGWNTSQVKDMQWLFGGASAFNRDLSNWNTAKVTTTFGMFQLATSFNQKLCWTLESLQDAGYMFVGSNGCIVGSCLKNAAMASSLVVCPMPVAIKVPPGYCFSGENSLRVARRGIISMKDLRIGDKVKDAKGTLVSVYSFGHYQPNGMAEFLQIFIQGQMTPLEVTKDHLVFSGDVPIPASTLSVGDRVQMGAGTSAGVIEKIAVVVRQGIYAPFTTSGTIEVSGVAASSYVTLQEESPVLVLGEWFPLTFSMHWLSHVFQAPHRMMCSLLGMSFCRKWETYNQDGISTWAEGPWNTFHRFANNEHGATLLLFFLPRFVLGLLLHAVEGSLMLMLLLAATAFYVFKGFRTKHGLFRTC